MYYTFESETSSLTRIRRERVLPKPGEVLVHPGDHVEATQIVARTNLPSDFRIVAVARLLGVLASEAEDHLQIDLGDSVHRGDVIAKRGGLLGRSVESPIDGVMTAIGGGRVLIEAPPVPFELHAYISGGVLNVRENRVVSVETVGALIQGAWGSGQESVGVLKGVTKSPSESLKARAVDASCHGSILFTGTTLDLEPLARAQDVEVRGIVTGGLSPALLSSVEQLPFPVIVTGGFGELPMMEDIFGLLMEHEGREASISGQTQMRWSSKRPEIIIPMPKSKPVDEARRHGELARGVRVRIVRAPYLGSVGTVIDIPQHARRIATGARAHCAEVDIGQDEPIFVPLVNLEILR